MSGLAYLLWSLAVGLLAVAAVFRSRQAAPPVVGWRRALLAVASMLFGFSLVAAAAHLLLGPHALSQWEVTASHAWLPTFGLVILLGLSSSRSALPTSAQRWIACFVIAIGALDLAIDLHPLIARI